MKLKLLGLSLLSLTAFGEGGRFYVGAGAGAVVILIP